MKNEWLSHKIQGTPWSSANSCGWFSTDMSVPQRMNSLLFLMITQHMRFLNLKC